MNKVIVVTSKNRPPQEAALDQALVHLGDEWEVVSATTAMRTWGKMMHASVQQPIHVYYATTIVLKKRGS